MSHFLSLERSLFLFRPPPPPCPRAATMTQYRLGIESFRSRHLSTTFRVVSIDVDAAVTIRVHSYRTVQVVVERAMRVAGKSYRDCWWWGRPALPHHHHSCWKKRPWRPWSRRNDRAMMMPIPMVSPYVCGIWIVVLPFCVAWFCLDYYSYFSSCWRVLVPDEDGVLVVLVVQSSRDDCHCC
jgi:hypothetical protein